MVPVYRLNGIRYGGGVNLIQAFMCNVGTCGSNDEGEIRWTHKNESTDAGHRGGPPRSSDEGR